METKKSYFAAPGIGIVQTKNMPDYILNKVAEFYGITREIMLSKTRKREILFPRQVSMTLIMKHTNCTLAFTGGLCGGYDHATVLNAKKTVNNLIDTDRKVRETIASLEAYISNAAASVLQTVIKAISVEFKSTPIDIILPERGKDNDYVSRCTAIYLMMDINKLSIYNLSILFNTEETRIEKALANRLMLSAADPDYFRKVEIIKKKIKETLQIV